jgi:hypothetical protein
MNWYCVAEDTEDRKFAGEKSPATEQDLRATVNTIPSLVWQAGPDRTLMTQPLDGSCGRLLCTRIIVLFFFRTNRLYDVVVRTIASPAACNFPCDMATETTIAVLWA